MDGAFPKLISFSGIDCAGKSTQIALLTSILQERGKKTKYLWTRGGYTGPFNGVKRVLRTVLGHKALPSGRTEPRAQVFRKKWVRMVWLTLALVDLILVYGVYVRWLQLMGRTVIADRYLVDTWIDFSLNYPDTGFDRWALWKVLLQVTPRPDHAFLLSIPVEESLHRSQMKKEPFPDPEDILRRRVEHYQQLAAETQWHVVDCTKPVAAVAEKITQRLFLPRS